MKQVLIKLKLLHHGFSTTEPCVKISLNSALLVMTSDCGYGFSKVALEIQRSSFLTIESLRTCPRLNLIERKLGLLQYVNGRAYEYAHICLFSLRAMSCMEVKLHHRINLVLC